MLTSLCLAAVVAPITIQASDDVWVYPHASDQINSEWLRCWGFEGKSVEDGDQTGSFSYSYLRFPLDSVKDSGTITKATLRIYNDPKPTFVAAESKVAPLEARAMTSNFNEAKWEYGMVKDIKPVGGDEGLFGSAFVVPADNGKPILIEIDLMAGKAGFAKAVESAIKNGTLTISIGLASKLDPQSSGQSSMYKFYSRSAEEGWRPQLILDFKP